MRLLLRAPTLGLLLVCTHAAPVPQRVDVTRDLWISSHEKEREGNNGASARLKLKGIQEFFLVDLDPAPLQGKRVVRAQLHLHLEGPETLGRITVSTVADEWIEGRGTGYAQTAGASSFSWRRTGEARWGGGEPDITGVIHASGGSRWDFGDASTRDADGWQVIPVAPDLVQARLDGRSHGFCVMDDVGNEYTRDGNTIHYRSFPNRYVSSREGPRRSAPYFTLWLDEGAAKEAQYHSAGAALRRDSPDPRGIKPLPHPTTAEMAPKTQSSRSPAVPGALPGIPPAPPDRAPPSVRCRDEFGEPLPALEFFAARNETIGFSVEAASLRVILPGLKTALYSMPLVAGQEDPLVPIDPASAPALAPTESSSIFVEIHVPKDAPAGRQVGTLHVAGRSIPLAVTVWRFTLPDRLSFIPQMNCYSLPGHDRAYYRLAHEHRTALNRLPYGWTGRVDRKYAPVSRADGSWDWTAWDAEFGPLLDGSAFGGLPRAGVPVDVFYLPLNENWPMDHEKHFRGGFWIESAYADDYWREFRAAAARFAQHFAARGWTEPMFEFFLNNKVYFKRDRGNRWDACSAPWIFDEPVNTQDFWALRRFGLEFWRGVAPHPGARFTFRADISRPEWQRDLLDGVTSAEVVSGILRKYRERVIGRAEQFGNFVSMYGAANRIGTPNLMPAAWCVETWALGADGVVPWQTIGKAGAWTTPDHLSLFYPTPAGPVPSLRLKSFRAGQQLTEYLTQYAAVSGQSRAAIGAAVLAEPGLRPALEKRSEADAGTSQFGAAARLTLATLRQRLGTWLDARAPAPRDRWHDPRPAPRDPAAVREIQVLPAPQGPP